MSVMMTTGQQVTLTAIERDARGNVVPPADVLNWSTDDTVAVVLAPSADGMSCLCTTRATGEAAVTVSDPAANLSASEHLSVSALPAASIEVAAGAPEDVPAA